MSAPVPTEVADPGLWAQLGAVGGIFAFIVVALWMSREYFHARESRKKDELIKELTKSYETESKVWREAIGKQWRDTDAANRQVYSDLVSLAERVATALAELKVFLEGRLK